MSLLRSLRRGLALLAVLTLATVPARAQVHVEGQTFDARTRVGAQDLVLNGVGLRAVSWQIGRAHV